jgi:hypothetical protein
MGYRAKAYQSAAWRWAQLKRQFAANNIRWDPLVAIVTLTQTYAASTAYRYAKEMRMFFGQELAAVHREDIKQLFKRLQTYANLAPNERAAVAATPAQVRKLIGDLTQPEQRAVYRMWTTASRHIETTQWSRTFFENDKMLQLKNDWSKSDPMGKTPHFKWVPCASLEQAALYDRTPELSYQRLMRWLQDREPTLSCHSFRKGAIQLLERSFRPTSIVHLTWHRNPNSVNTSMNPYSVATPLAPIAQTITRMTLLLQQSVM